MLHPTAPSSNPLLLPAVILLTVLVLLLITCVALLMVTVAVLSNKLNKKAHTDPPHYYNQTGRGEGKTKEGIYEEVEVERTATVVQRGHYQELELGTMEKGQYERLNKSTTDEN